MRICYTSKNQLLVDNSGEILVCKITEEKKIEVESKFKIHEAITASIIELPNGLFVSGSIDKTVRVWNLEGKIFRTMNFDGMVIHLHWNKLRPNFLFVCANEVSVWNMEANERVGCWNTDRDRDLVLGLVELNNDHFLPFNERQKSFRITHYDYDNKKPNEEPKIKKVEECGPKEKCGPEEVCEEKN